WVERQQSRYPALAGFSFTVVKASTDEAVGHCGLWLKELGEGRAAAGYSIVPSARGRGLAMRHSWRSRCSDGRCRACFGSRYMSSCGMSVLSGLPNGLAMPMKAYYAV